MVNSKLVQLLESFSAEEFERYLDFVSSPYFNTREELIPLARYLQRQFPDFSSESLEKSLVFTTVYPGEMYDEKQLAYRMNYLLKLGEQFLGIERYQANEERVALDKLRVFTERKLEKHYRFLQRKTAGNLEGALQRDADSLYWRFQLADIASEHFIQQGVRRFDDSFQQASEALDDFYFFNKLRYSCGMKNLQFMVSGEFQEPMIEEITSYLSRQKEVDPHTEMYLQIYHTYEDDGSEHYFQRLLELIDQYTGIIVANEMRAFYLAAINYCARKIRKGETNYYEPVLDLYQKGVEKKILLDGKYLSHQTYSNVVRLALRLRRFEWLQYFINEYGPLLHPDKREDAIYYNLAELAYYQQNYDEVLEMLQKLHFTDMQYNLGARVLMIKTWYEKDAIDSMLSALASFTMYLRRNKNISTQLKKTLLNFCNSVNLVMRSNPDKLEKVQAKLTSTQPLIEQSWLLDLMKRELA